MPTRTIDNGEDILDSRDIIARIEELQAVQETAIEDGQTLDESDTAELAALLALQSEAEGSPDWTHGETLIRDSYFERYAQDLADDLGCIPDGARWPLTCIDWEQAARELQYDYSAVDFDGVTYWLRS